MPRCSLESLWDTITEINRDFPNISGWSKDGKSFHVSSKADEREYFIQRYYFYSSRFRKNSAMNWYHICSLILKYGYSEGKFLGCNFYNIPNFEKGNRDLAAFCMLKKKKKTEKF